MHRTLLAVLLPDPTSITPRIVSFFGVFVMLVLAYAMSFNRKKIAWKPVIWGVVLTYLTGLLVLTPVAQTLFFKPVDDGINRLLGFAQSGSDFLFSSIEHHEMGDGKGASTGDLQGKVSPPLKTFAFSILPTIVFFSSLMSVLYHFGIMQRVVYGIAWLMVRTAKISGAESLSTAANIFLGQTEAPLTVKPYIATMTNSELFLVMLGGFSNAAGGVLAAYVVFLQDIPGIAGHLFMANLLTAPAGIAVSKIMFPETEKPETQEMMKLDTKSTYGNVFEAAAEGASEGMKLLLNVGAMLIAFVALVAMADYGLGLIHIHGEPMSMARIFGWVFSPIAYAMGVPKDEVLTVGRLLGEKITLTEFISYIHLGDAVRAPVAVLSQRSVIISAYALCGFANFASIGIQLGGIGGMAPKRMGDLSKIAFRSMLGGTVTSFIVGCIAGIFV